MRNRAKCKLCHSIIESFHEYDFVSCKCGEISVDGGDSLKCGAINWDNFLRVDDDGNTIVPKIKEKASDKGLSEETLVNPMTKDEMLNELDRMITSIEELPPIAMSTPITHYDFVSALMLLRSILRS